MSQRVPFNLGFGVPVASEALGTNRQRTFGPRQTRLKSRSLRVYKSIFTTFSTSSLNQEPATKDPSRDSDPSFLSGRPHAQTRKVFQSMTRQAPRSATLAATSAPSMAFSDTTMPPPPKGSHNLHPSSFSPLLRQFSVPSFPPNATLHRPSFLATHVPRVPVAKKLPSPMTGGAQPAMDHSSRSNSSILDSDEDTLCNELQSASSAKRTGQDMMDHSPSRIATTNAFPPPGISIQPTERPTKRRRLFHAQQKSIDRLPLVRNAT